METRRWGNRRTAQFVPTKFPVLRASKNTEVEDLSTECAPLFLAGFFFSSLFIADFLQPFNREVSRKSHHASIPEINSIGRLLYAPSKVPQGNTSEEVLKAAVAG